MNSDKPASNGLDTSGAAPKKLKFAKKTRETTKRNKLKKNPRRSAIIRFYTSHNRFGLGKSENKIDNKESSSLINSLKKRPKDFNSEKVVEESLSFAQKLRKFKSGISVAKKGSKSSKLQKFQKFGKTGGLEHTSGSAGSLIPGLNTKKLKNRVKKNKLKLKMEKCGLEILKLGINKESPVLK